MNRSPAFNKFLWLFVLGLVLGLPCEASSRFEALVVHISSGDTFTLHHDGLRTPCRLAAVDAPELDQPYGANAKKALGTLVFNRRVLVEVIDQESMLVRLALDGFQVHEVLLNRGLAWVAPAQDRNSRLLLLQSHSRDARRGLWRSDVYVAPWRWRAGFRM